MAQLTPVGLDQLAHLFNQTVVPGHQANGGPHHQVVAGLNSLTQKQQSDFVEDGPVFVVQPKSGLLAAAAEG